MLDSKCREIKSPSTKYNKRKIDTDIILAVYPDYDIVVIKGRFGPYIQHAGNNYKLPKNIEKQKLSLEYCLEVIKLLKEYESYIKSKER